MPGILVICRESDQEEESLGGARCNQRCETGCDAGNQYGAKAGLFMGHCVTWLELTQRAPRDQIVHHATWVTALGLLNLSLPLVGGDALSICHSGVKELPWKGGGVGANNTRILSVTCLRHPETPMDGGAAAELQSQGAMDTLQPGVTPRSNPAGKLTPSAEPGCPRQN